MIHQVKRYKVKPQKRMSTYIKYDKILKLLEERKQDARWSKEDEK